MLGDGISDFCLAYGYNKLVSGISCIWRFFCVIIYIRLNFSKEYMNETSIFGLCGGDAYG